MKKAKGGGVVAKVVCGVAWRTHREHTTKNNVTLSRLMVRYPNMSTTYTEKKKKEKKQSLREGSLLKFNLVIQPRLLTITQAPIN